MKQTKLTSGIVGVFAVIAIIIYWQAGIFWWLALGLVIGLGGATILFSLQEADVKADDSSKILIEQMSTLQVELAEARDGAERQRKEFQLKEKQAYEECEAYKRLVQIHRLEVEQLQDNVRIVNEGLLQKTKRVRELELYLQDPALMPHVEQEQKDFIAQKAAELTQAQQAVISLEEKLALLQGEIQDRAVQPAKEPVEKPPEKKRMLKRTKASKSQPLFE